MSAGDPDDRWTETDPVAVLRAAIPFSSQRKRQLFGCAVCRQVSTIVGRSSTSRLIRLIEGYIDGEVRPESLRRFAEELDQDESVTSSVYWGDDSSYVGLREFIRDLFRSNLEFEEIRQDMYPEQEPSYARELWRVEGPIAELCKVCAIETAGNPWRIDQPEARLLFDKEIASYATIARDIFGNPFRPVAFDSRWRTEDTLGLARGIYDDRAFDRLPLLADALMDSGCDADDILQHCRSEGPHVRGCWVVDLVLGKE